MGIPVTDADTHEILGAGFRAVTDNITNLGTQVDNSLAANTDEVVAQLKGLPLTLTKYQSAMDHERTPIPAGNCSYVAQSRKLPNIEADWRAMAITTRRQLRVRLDQRDDPVAAAKVALDNAIALAESQADTSNEHYSLMDVFLGDMDDAAISAARRKWDFSIMPIKESIPDEVRNQDVELPPSQSYRYTAMQARNERLEIAAEVGNDLINRRATRVDIEDYSEFFAGYSGLSGETSLEELDKRKATFRLRSEAWQRCVNEDCSEKQLLSQLAIMAAEQGEMSYRIATALDKQNLLLSVMLASLEEERARLVADNHGTGFGEQ